MADEEKEDKNKTEAKEQPGIDEEYAKIVDARRAVYDLEIQREEINKKLENKDKIISSWKNQLEKIELDISRARANLKALMKSYYNS